MKKQALIIGASSQDGIYLSRFLASKDYKVFGLVRGQDNPKIQLLQELSSDLIILEGDLLDQGSILRAIEASSPQEIYNLGAISHVGYSWKHPILTGEVTGLGLARLLESVRQLDRSIKVYQASTSELFGNCGPEEFPLNEKVPFRPRSPYAVAKLYAHWIAYTYRQSYDMFVACGILFNHESPIRGEMFVTRKITKGVAEIAAGIRDHILLGNTTTKRDWGYAKDFVEAMWLMLQQDKPDDYVVCTGEAHSIQELIEIAFEAAGLDPRDPYIQTSADLMRPADVNILLGDNTKAKEILGWEPKVRFGELIRKMVKSDQHLIKYGRINPEMI